MRLFVLISFLILQPSFTFAASLNCITPLDNQTEFLQIKESKGSKEISGVYFHNGVQQNFECTPDKRESIAFVCFDKYLYDGERRLGFIAYTAAQGSKFKTKEKTYKMDGVVGFAPGYGSRPLLCTTDKVEFPIKPYEIRDLNRRT